LTSGRFEFPKLKVVINLAPSGVKKSGSHFDLAMAISLLREAGQILLDSEELSRIGFISELSLNAELRPVSGVLLMAISARESGIHKLIVPIENFREASLVNGLEIYAFETLVCNGISASSLCRPK